MPANLFFILLLFAFAAYGQQQERVAIINTVDDGDSIKFSDLNYLTVRLRETAVNVLPKSRYVVMSMQSIVDFLGSEERATKECKEASCLAELGRKVNADYVAQARIGRFNKDLTIGVELYNSKSSAMVGSFTGDSKSLPGLLAIINEKAPILFKELANDLEKIITHYELGDGKSFTDARDGQKYRTVVIGKQTWMAENLNYNANDSKCYDNKLANCQKYGRLYNWETAKTACPKGWHLPTKAEWDVLMATVGGEKTAGKFLKAMDGWNQNGNVGYLSYWWSASEYNNDAYYRIMDYDSEYIGYYYNDKSFLFSVRCVKD